MAAPSSNSKGSRPHPQHLPPRAVALCWQGVPPRLSLGFQRHETHPVHPGLLPLLRAPRRHSPSSCCFGAREEEEEGASLNLTGAGFPLSQCLIHVKPGLSGHVEFHGLGWWGTCFTSPLHKHCCALQDLDNQATT